MDVGDARSNNGTNNDDTARDNCKGNFISLDISESLQQQQILTAFVVNNKTGCIIASLNHIYDKKTIVSNIYGDWIKTLDAFTIRAKKKGVSEEHINMLTDALDENNEKVMQCLYDRIKQENIGSDRNAVVALELVRDKMIDLFLDEVKAPYAVIKVDGHIETVPIKSQKFEDWAGALYYYHEKEQGHNSVLCKEAIGRVQSVLGFEAINKDVKTLHVRIAAFVDTDNKNLDENTVIYDLCNKNWEIGKINRHDWNIEQNYDQVLFKRFPIMNPQVYPRKDYPPDIMDQFIRLTNVYDDEDSKLLAEVYLVSLFILANLPKPMMIPHGIHGSGKSTFQEYIKLVVDPSAALTTAFPNSLPELVQILSHSYLIFFDNVSEMSQLLSDQLCRAVTGSGFSKRGLYTNDEDFIYNVKRAVGNNGINVAATRADLLDRILNIQLKPIDRRHRRKLKSLYNDLERILPYLLGYIFDVIVKVLGRIGEVKLEELPRMADFAEIGELIARCLGYEEGTFTKAYNANIGFTNEEAINASLVATAVIHLMNTQAIWSGMSKDLLSKLNDMINRTPDISWISKNKEWPKTPRTLSDRLNEVIPNLRDIGIIVHREHDSHTKSDRIMITNNNYQPTGLVAYRLGREGWMEVNQR
jgi:hypothetical protein